VPRRLRMSSETHRLQYPPGQIAEKTALAC
jgi:hypothetical protein